MKSTFFRIVENRYLHLIVGVLVILSAFDELLEEFQTWSEFDGLETHHGIALVGLWHVVKALSEIYESVVVIEE